MIYDIKLRLAYDYGGPAVGGRHIVCILPKEPDAQQRTLAGLIEIDPKPAERLDRVDFFGNRVTEFSFRAPHRSVVITMQARVDRQPAAHSDSGSLTLAEMPVALGACRDLGPDSPLHFLASSVRVPRDPAMTDFARALMAPGMTVADFAVALGHALNGYLRFDASATEVDTPASEAFAKRHGVCQDFSHIMIACLRGVGVPAGYVSGYLRTYAPPGKPRLEGADAMHAWVRIWCGPGYGWLEFDPTNDMIAGADHIVVARARDYSDVAPIKGAMRISGKQKSKQAVDVVPVDA